MSDLALLIGAITGLVAAVGTATAGIITALRAGKGERKRAARGALERLAEAAQDGQITPDEVASILAAEDEDGDEA